VYSTRARSRSHRKNHANSISLATPGPEPWQEPPRPYFVGLDQLLCGALIAFPRRPLTVAMVLTATRELGRVVESRCVAEGGSSRDSSRPSRNWIIKPSGRVVMTYAPRATTTGGHGPIIVTMEAVIPGLARSPFVFVPRRDDGFLWHFMFNPLFDLPEMLIEGRERAYLFSRSISAHTSVKQSRLTIMSRRTRLRVGFSHYRAIPQTIAQNVWRAARKLTMPVVAL
jgi:hypothetical protein